MAKRAHAEVQPIDEQPHPTVVEGALGSMEGARNSEVPLSEPEALAYDDVIKRYATTVRFQWYELGDAAKVIKDRALWKAYEAPAKEEPFHSFDDYVNRRGQKSRTAIYRALQLRVGLSVLAESDCRQTSQANAMWLLRLVKRLNADHPEKVLTAKVITAAQTMQEKEFGEYCNAMLPGAAAEEPQEKIIWNVDKSLARVLDESLQVAMWDAETDDKKVAIERIVTFYLESKCEHEGFHRLSNRAAYQKASGKKRAAKSRVN